MSRSGYGFRVDNRDENCTWLWVIDIDDKEEEIGVMEVDRKDVYSILESFFVNQVQNEGGEFDEEKFKMNNDSLKESLKELYDWTLNIILECGCDVDGGKVVEKKEE